MIFSNSKKITNFVSYVNTSREIYKLVSPEYDYNIRRFRKAERQKLITFDTITLSRIVHLEERYVYHVGDPRFVKHSGTYFSIYRDHFNCRPGKYV